MDDEELARLRAQMDQAAEGMKEFASTLWAFFSSLKEQGFSDRHAIQLTDTWLSAMTLKNNEGDE
jgi:hypothetical protein